MRLFISTVCLVAATLCCSITTAEELNLYDPLPAATQQMDDVEFRRWAKEHNRLAYQRAAKRAINTSDVTLVTTSEFETTGQNYYNYYGSFPSSGQRRETTRAYSRNTWRGGPVLIVNPYVR